MKRVLSCLLVFVMLVSLSVTAFAAHKDIAFVAASDAEGKDASEFVTVTQFDDRDSLPEEDRALYEDGIEHILLDFEEAAKSDPAVMPSTPDSVIAMYDTVYVSLAESEELKLPYTVDLTAADSYKVSMMYVDGAWVVVDTEIVDGNVRYTLEKSAPIVQIIEYVPAPAPDEDEKGDDGDFHPSRERTEQPEILEVVDANGKNADDNLSVVIYHDKNDLPEVHKDVFSLAYEDLYENFDEIVAADEEIGAAADGKEVAVSDAFFVSANNSAKIDYNLRLRLDLPKYSTEDSDDFVALIQCVDGEWSFAESKVDGDVLTASIDHIGPFAIVVFSAA